LFATDILKALYAPQKVFKQIVQNPKYWGPLFVLIIFVAVGSGFYYNLYSKTYYEQTSPTISNLSAWTVTPSLWTINPSGAISSNYLDYLNSTAYGNSSIQFSVSNASSISLTLSGIGNVDCGSNGFKSLSMRIKQVDTVVPTNATLTLFSLTQTDRYQRDLTSFVSNSTLIGSWNNITVPVGQTSGWQTAGNPQWGNITGLKLDLNYGSNGTITIRMQGLFFRGVFETPLKTDFGTYIFGIMSTTAFQFIEEWIILSAIIFLLIKAFKGNVVWKPLFVAIGCALVVLIVQSLINIIAVSTLSIVNYPVELLTGLPGEAELVISNISAQTVTYTTIVTFTTLAIYVWTAALSAIIIRDLIPEYTWRKSISIAAIAVLLTIIILSVLSSLGF
jgi:hypothetical protein